MGQSILRDREAPFQNFCMLVHTSLSKGNPVKILELGCGLFSGNANELGDTGKDPGKSSLFSLTALYPLKLVCPELRVNSG